MRDIDICVWKLRMVKEAEIPYRAISNPDDIFEFLTDSLKLNTATEEYMYMLTTDNHGNVTSVSQVSHGDLGSSVASAQSIFKRALISNAATIILCHNHPSGHTEPSEDDIRTTRRLADAGDLLGVRVLDHIIVGHGEYFSFKKEGLL